MAYSDNFPATRPVFMADFANGGKIDPRATFTRSDTPPTYAAPSAVHFWSNEKHLSSENLLLQSSDFDTTWNSTGLNGTPTSGQTDPAGGTDGFTVVETSDTNFHRLWQGVTASGDFAFTVYAKQNSGTRYLSLTLYNASSDWVGATFDLAGSAPTKSSGSLSSFSGLTATQTPSGGGYYKCTIKATGSVTSAQAVLNNVTSAPTGGYGLPSYAGDGTSSIDVAFASLSTTGATDYNATTTSIHRQYASSLKSVATAGQPRFEYDPSTDGQSAGTSLGILVEGQSTNLITYSNNFSAWSGFQVTAEAGAAVGPDGQSCYVMREDSTAASNHYLSLGASGQSTSTTYTMSVYAKKVASSNQTRHLRLRVNGLGGQASVEYDLGNGTVNRTYGSSLNSQSISSIGNGWYRLVMTYTNGSGSVASGMIITGSPDTTANLPSYDGDGFSAFALFGAQVEEGSFASSLVSTSGSAATRASESLSMTDSSLFDNGGGTLYAEASQNVLDTYNGVFAVSDGTGANTIEILGNSSSFRGQVVNANSTNASFIGGTITVGQFNKHALTFSSSEASYYVNGSEIGTTDSSVVIPTVSEIDIGNVAWSRPLNGHVRKVALYSEPISETAAAAITS